MEAPDGDRRREGGGREGNAGALSLLSEEKLEEDEADVAEPWRDGQHQHQQHNGRPSLTADHLAGGTTPLSAGARPDGTPQRGGGGGATEVVDISGLTDDQLVELFAQLPPDMLAQRKKALQDWALHLGLEEAREMQRGRLLNILTPTPPPPSSTPKSDQSASSPTKP